MNLVAARGILSPIWHPYYVVASGPVGMSVAVGGADLVFRDGQKPPRPQQLSFNASAISEAERDTWYPYYVGSGMLWGNP